MHYTTFYYVLTLSNSTD